MLLERFQERRLHNSMALAWIAFALLFALAEAGTVSLFAGFLCLGAVGAAAVAFAGWGPLTQAAAFGVTSFLGIVLVRPWLLGVLRRRANVTRVSGASAMIGESALVLPSSEKSEPHGHVKIWGESWPAVTRDGSALISGATVQIVDIEGTTLVVEPIPKIQGKGEASSGGPAPAGM
jgi:membrane protein implicated in regulation of membrane protease activity